MSLDDNINTRLSQQGERRTEFVYVDVHDRDTGVSMPRQLRPLSDSPADRALDVVLVQGFAAVVRPEHGVPRDLVVLGFLVVLL